LAWDSVRDPFFTPGIEITHFENVLIRDFRGAAAPFDRSSARPFLSQLLNPLALLLHTM
jgi:hypothetical protein